MVLARFTASLLPPLMSASTRPPAPPSRRSATEVTSHFSLVWRMASAPRAPEAQADTSVTSTSSHQAPSLVWRGPEEAAT